MCLAVFPHPTQVEIPADSIKLVFALENIYQRRDGSTQIGLDLLIRNDSQHQIDRLRVVIPYPLIETSGLDRMISKSESKAEERIASYQQKQIDNFGLQSHQFAHNSHPSHWMYLLLPEIEMDYDSTGGTLTVTRSLLYDTKAEPIGFESQRKLQGFVKHGWSVEQPEDLDKWTWLVFALNECSVFDVAVRDNAGRESLKPSEQMWFRFTLKVPATGFNKKSIVELLFARTREYRQEFQSPGRVTRVVTNKIQNLDMRLWLTDELRAEALNTKRQALHIIRRTGSAQTANAGIESIEVQEWRTLLYREYGTAFLQIDTPSMLTNGAPVVGHIKHTLLLPPAADPPGARRSPLPMFLHWLGRKKSRHDLVVEFYFGTEFTKDYPDNYAFETSTRSVNPLYLYVTWLALIVSIVSLVVSLR